MQVWQVVCACLHFRTCMHISLIPNARTSSAPQLQKRGNEKCVGRVCYAQKCLDVGMLPRVDEGKNISPANQRSSSTNDRKQTYGRT